MADPLGLVYSMGPRPRPLALAGRTNGPLGRKKEIENGPPINDCTRANRSNLELTDDGSASSAVLTPPFVATARDVGRG